MPRCRSCKIGAGAASASRGTTPKVYRNGYSSTEANKAVVRRIYDHVINQENPAVIGETFAADAVIHDPFMDMPPTGKSVEVNGLELFRLVDGRIVEFWRKDDDAGLLMQLGAIPTPDSVPA